MEKLVFLFRHHNISKLRINKEDGGFKFLVLRINGLLIRSASVTLSFRLQSKHLVLDSSSSLALKLRNQLIACSLFLDQRWSISEIT